MFSSARDGRLVYAIEGSQENGIARPWFSLSRAVQSLGLAVSGRPHIRKVSSWLVEDFSA